MQENVQEHGGSLRPHPTLGDYYRMVAGKKKQLLAVAVLAGALSVGVALMLPDVYTAKAMLYPVQEDKNSMSLLMGQLGGLAGLAGGSLGGATQGDLYVTLLKSDTIRDAVIDRFRLMEVYKQQYRSTTYQVLDRNSSFKSDKRDGVVTIDVDDRDPKRAAEIANAYVEELGKAAVRLNASGAGKNREFLSERLVKARGDLAQAEESLKLFQAKNRAVDVPGQSKASIEGIAKLKAELAVQEVKLATLRTRFADSSASVRGASVAVDQLRSQISRQESGGEGGAIPSVAAMPALGQQYVRLMREFKMQEALVELLTKQYEMANLAESKDFAPFQVIQKAKAPDRKSKPNRALVAVAFTVTALVLAVLVVIVRALLARRLLKVPGEGSGR